MKFNLDADGTPTSVYFKVQKDSNKLIEDFMLLANKHVATVLSKALPKKNEKNPTKSAKGAAVTLLY